MARSQMALQSSPVPKRTGGIGYRVLGLGAWGRSLSQTGCSGMLPEEGTSNRGWEVRKGTSMHIEKSDLPQAEVRARAKALRWGCAWFYKTHG